MDKEVNKRNKSYALRKVEDNLNGAGNEITEGSDVASEPFPSTEEEYKSNEQYHFGAIQSNKPL